MIINATRIIQLSTQICTWFVIVSRSLACIAPSRSSSAASHELKIYYIFIFVTRY